MMSTVADEGGKFIGKQVEVGQPLLKTVGNISSTIGSSDFVQGVTGGAGSVARDAPQLIGTGVGLVQNTAQVWIIFLPHIFLKP